MNRNQLLAEHRAIEAEGDRSPARDEATLTTVEDSGVRKLEDLLNGGRTSQLLNLTPARIREMSPIERRMLLDFGVARIREFETKVALLSRTMVVGELVIPEHLRERGAA